MSTLSTFNDLNISKQLSKALKDLGFETPTPIQQKAFPILMSGRDAVGIAQTGTGKTFAYLLPILRQLTYSEQRQPRALIVVPTRELVVQVVGEVEKLAKYMSVRCVGVFGGANINIQKQQVYSGVDILVATPGRLMDLFFSRNLQFHSVKKLVIDEVDEMLNLGFRPQLIQVIENLPAKRQNLLFSATLTEDVEAIMTEYFRDPVFIEPTSRGTTLEKISQAVYPVPNFYTKVNLLTHLLHSDERISKALVFVKNKRVADKLMEEMSEVFPGELDVIHSNKSQKQRFLAVEQLQAGNFRFLVTTNVLARGLDIADISHVINFDLPNDPAVYIHRIGRTGRADKKGTAISFVKKTEKDRQQEIEKLMNKKIPVLSLPEEVEISTELLREEVPVKRDKNLLKAKRTGTPVGAFHEKSEKNSQTPNIGKRRQENKRRLRLKSLRKRKG